MTFQLMKRKELLRELFKKGDESKVAFLLASILLFHNSE